MSSPAAEPADAGPDSPNAHPSADPASSPRLALGRAHSCLAFPRDKTLCWGDNSRGQLGTAPSAAPVTSPVAFPVSADIVGAGGDRTCVFDEGRDADGVHPAVSPRLRCAGEGFAGLAAPAFRTFRAATGQRVSVDAVVVSNDAVCLVGDAAIDGGWLRCDDGAKSLRPFEHEGFACCSPGCRRTVCPRVGLQLTLRGADACLLSFDNGPDSWIECSRKAWSATYEPARLGDRETYAINDIAVGAGFVCALDASGVASCWGDAVGAATATRAILVRNFRQVRTLCATTKELCGLDVDGAVHCAPSSDLTAHPVNVHGTATQLACGDRHACALTEEGSVECWGDNERGQLGDGTTTAAPPDAPRVVRLPVSPPRKGADPTRGR